MNMKAPKKLSDYIHFITIIYGGVMNKEGIIECIMANSVGYANGLVSKNTFLKAERHWVEMLKR
jgi:hypothetical protein